MRIRRALLKIEKRTLPLSASEMWVPSRAREARQRGEGGEIIEGEEEGRRFSTLGRGFCVGVTPLGEWLFLVQSVCSIFRFSFSFGDTELVIGSAIITPHCDFLCLNAGTRKISHTRHRGVYVSVGA